MVAVNTHAALREVICENACWMHPMGPGFTFKFNQDGTGEVRAIGEMGLNWLFELSMQWKFISAPTSTADILNEECFRHLKHTNILTKRPTLLGSIRLEIQQSPIASKESVLLLEAAYLPRQFTIVVEKGNFAAVRDYRHELRMTFDASPYPTLDGYSPKKGRGGPPGDDVYELLSQTRSFYAGKPSDEVLKARATEDDTIMGHHTSSCVMS